MPPDDPKTTQPAVPSDPVPQLGKSYRGQQFYPVRTEADVVAQVAENAEYASPDALTLDAFFAIAGVRDPVMQASLRAYTKVTTATREAWVKIFENH